MFTLMRLLARFPELCGPHFLIVIVELVGVVLVLFSHASGETQQFVIFSIAWMELLLCLLDVGLDVSSVSQVLLLRLLDVGLDVRSCRF